MPPISLLSAFLSLTPAAAAGDAPLWGGFRGNDGSGSAADGRVPAAFDPEANLLWRREVPPGYSSPIVHAGRVYLTASEGRHLLTLAVDSVSGEMLWRSSLEFDGERVGANSSASPTPATDGERVVACFHHVGLVAYDLDGKELWRNPVGSPFDIPHGMSSSPLLHDGKVFLQVDQDSASRVLALDAASGEVLWTAERPGVTHGYATPAIHRSASGPEQLVVSSALQLAGYSTDQGEKLWWAGGPGWQTKATPVFLGDLCIVNGFIGSSAEVGFPAIDPDWKKALAERDTDGDGFISREEIPNPSLHMAWFVIDLDDDDKLGEADWAYLASSSRETGRLFAVRLGGSGDVTESRRAWAYDKSRGLSDVVSPVLVGETLFIVKEGGVLTSMNARTGEVVKQDRVGSPDRYFASPVAAGGRVLLASLGGQLSVVDAKPEWELLSTADLGEELWSTPALAGELVFVRTQQALYCFFSEEG